ncbi:aromatic prenyltransferase [Fusarium agapanthi]|uniref:Aromatic prenyltransferase n=1 Tax=Fusarium agapanthi TaxID=1803897 RepID=A0A9P5E5T7_9HYPO|nr:aromatic prenyltransferase [Fusarium agapanthi]
MPAASTDHEEALRSTAENKPSDLKAKEDCIAFWTKHTKPVLTSLLKSVGGYTPEQQAAHLGFLDNYIIPTMGRAPEKDLARSLLTPNGSPFETSLNNSDSGKSYVRFCYEPVFPGSDGVTEDPIPGIAEKTGADLRWFNQFAAEFYPSEEDAVSLAEKMSKDTIRTPKVFLAFDLKDDKQTMKAYFYPVINWELKPGQDIPEVKIYVPLNQYFKNNKDATEAMEKVFQKRGWAWGIEGTYKKIVSDAYGSEVIDDTVTTITEHTFVSFNFSQKKGVYMTTYVAPFVRFP